MTAFDCNNLRVLSVHFMSRVFVVGFIFRYGLQTFYATQINVCVFLSVYSSIQKSEEKRGGSGSNNWGNVKDEVK